MRMTKKIANEVSIRIAEAKFDEKLQKLRKQIVILAKQEVSKGKLMRDDIPEHLKGYVKTYQSIVFKGNVRNWFKKIDISDLGLLLPSDKWDDRLYIDLISSQKDPLIKLCDTFTNTYISFEALKENVYCELRGFTTIAKLLKHNPEIAPFMPVETRSSKNLPDKHKISEGLLNVIKEVTNEN